MRYFFFSLVLILSACGGRWIQPPLDSPAPGEVKSTLPTQPAEPTEPPASPAPSPAGPGGLPDDSFEGNMPLAARVNNQPIFLETYEKQVAQFVQALQAQPAATKSHQDPAAELAHIRRQVLEMLINQQIIEQQARQLGLTVTDAMLEAKIQTSRPNSDPAQFDAWLAANQLTEAEFKEILRSQLLASQLFEQVTQAVADTAEQIWVRQIVVADERSAQAMMAQLQSGADFAQLAQEQSQDDRSQGNGGDLGWFPRQASPLPPEVTHLAFSLPPGELGGPIQTSFGFHILKLENREAARPLTSEAVQALKEQLFMDWLMDQRSSTVIKEYIAL